MFKFLSGVYMSKNASNQLISNNFINKLYGILNEWEINSNYDRSEEIAEYKQKLENIE